MAGAALGMLVITGILAVVGFAFSDDDPFSGLQTDIEDISDFDITDVVDIVQVPLSFMGGIIDLVTLPVDPILKIFLGLFLTFGWFFAIFEVLL